VVGISAKSPNFASACRVAGLVKKVSRDILVVVGGPHVSMVGAEALGCGDIDVGVKGEGERTMVEVLEAVEGKRGFEGIQGIVYRRGGTVAANRPREFIQDVDELCFPHESAAETLIDYGRYPRTAFKNIFTIRGCAYNCFFCGSRKIWSQKVRMRSPESVVEEIRGLQEMGVRTVHFDDDTFGVTRKHIIDLCYALIQRCPGLRWSCEMHVKLVDEATIALMEAAGCQSILVGIESGNDQILQAMRKHITVAEAVRACEIIKKHDIILQSFFIVGFPQETEETLADTVRVMEEVNCDYLVYSIFTPYPGTEAFAYCQEQGLIGDDYDISRYNHQSPANSFSVRIPPERFRELVGEIEKMVDQRNYLRGIKRTLSLNTFRRIRELGLASSIQKGMRILTGK
jgi:radical SAM superfamily enzyme YgiQ (UPF0313 family)